MNIEDQIRGLENEILAVRGVSAKQVHGLCKELIELGEQHQIDAALGFAYYFLGENYYLLNDVKNCFLFMMKGLEKQRDNKQWALAARSYNLLALNSMNQGNAPFAIDYFLSGLDCCRLCKDPEEEGLIELNLGALFLQNGDIDRASHYAKEAIIIQEQLEEGPQRNRNLITAYILLANCALVENELEQVLKCRKQVSEIYLEKDNTIKIILHILDLRISDRMGGPEIFERKLSDLLRVSRRDFPILEVADELLEFCNDLLERKRYLELEQLLDTLDHHLEQADILHLRLRALRLRLSCFEETGQKEALAAGAIHYYQLLKRQEKEQKYLTGNMLEVRLNLAQLTKKQIEVEQKNRELQEKSERDALTGLPNRFKLNDYSEETFEYAYQTRSGFAIEILDVDFFKEFNDTYGHSDGDYCLRMVGDILKKRTEDSRVFAARYGGDEFMVIYRDMTVEEIARVAQQIKDEVEEASLRHEGSKVADYVTVSQGIHYGIPVPGNKVWDFLHAADEALYEVKRSSRNGICIDDSTITAVRE